MATGVGMSHAQVLLDQHLKTQAESLTIVNFIVVYIRIEVTEQVIRNCVS